MSQKNLSIAIVGGGLAGLASAAGLARAGFDVEVFEQSRAIREVGAGINISPQATKALQGIGVGDLIREVGNEVTGQTFRSLNTGDVVTEQVLADPDAGPEDPSRKYSAPYYVFHRADLLEVLAKAAGPDRVHLQHRLVSLTENDDSVVLEFENGVQREFDVVIGADGIHSRVRTQIYGEDPAQFAGQMVWRALVDGKLFPSDVLGPHHFTGWVGKGRHLMIYHLRGSDTINITSQADSDSWVEEGWSITGNPDDMRAMFPDAEPKLKKLLDAVNECSKWGLFTREPTHDWGRGRIQLIGDAAHPMLPNVGQGAAQAFEDAYVLTQWLKNHSEDLENALEGFRSVRIPRAHAIQRQSLINNRIAHAGDWESRKDTFKERQNAGDTNLGVGWIYDYEPAEQWSTPVEYPLSSAMSLDA